MIPNTALSSLAASGSFPGIAILPLRLFLGLTFIYAGIQKLTDPGFFHPGSSSYIGTQLLAYSRGSPIRFVLTHFMEHAVPIGILTILTEIAIGLAVLLGIFTRPAAVIGAFLNFMFFLSASWHTYPYFFGSDIVWVMCWLTVAITGPGAFALEGLTARLLNERLSPALARVILGPVPLGTAAPEHSGADVLDTRGQRSNIFTRRESLLGALGAVMLVILGLVPRSTVGGSPAALGFASRRKSGGSTAGGHATGTPGQTNGSGGSGGGNGSFKAPAGARKIGNVSQLPNNSGGTVTDPKTGDPAIVVHSVNNKFYAYDAVCTHAGCTVSYDPQQQMIACPCHGAVYDPTKGAQVVTGPAPYPLTKLPLAIDPHGNIYLV